jgi:hypothetical protein
MAAGDRSKQIKERVRFVTGLDELGMSDPLLYGIMGDRANLMAQETLCIEKITTSLVISATDGTGTLPTGYFRAKQLQLPYSIRIQPTEIDVNQMDFLKRQLISPALNIVQWFSIWNGVITLWPNPGAQTYTLLYYVVPTTTPSGSVDPETPQYMDETLKYGIAAEAMLYQKKYDENARFVALYEQEKERARLTQRRNKSLSNVIAYQDL